MKRSEHRILHCDDAEHGCGPAGEEWGFAKAIAGVCEPTRVQVPSGLGAFGAGLAFEDQPVKVPGLAGFDQDRAGFGGDALDLIDATDGVEGSFGEEAGPRKCLRDIAQVDRFDLNGFWILAHLAYRSKLVSGAKAPKTFLAFSARLKPCPFKIGFIATVL